jgi:hypothetical protein
MDAIAVDDAAQLVRALRAAGLAESTIQGVLVAAGRIFKFARRRMRFSGDNPIGLLESGERPRLADAPERRIYTAEELAQVLAASWEPWTTLFRLANVEAGRESELLRLWWENLSLSDLDAATIAFTHQVDRRGGSCPAQDGGVEGGAAAAADCSIDDARAPGALAARRPARVRVRNPDGPAARPAQRAPGALCRAGAGAPVGRNADLPRALRARTSAGTWSWTSGASTWYGVSIAASSTCPTFTPSDTVRRWTATTPSRRACCCATRTRTSRGRSTARTSVTASASCCEPGWRRAMGPSRRPNRRQAARAAMSCRSTGRAEARSMKAPWKRQTAAGTRRGQRPRPRSRSRSVMTAGRSRRQQPADDLGL